MITEPSSAFGLWPRVRAISGWPETNEDAVRELATGWNDAAAGFTTAGEFDVAAVTGAWPDSAGGSFVTRSRQNLDAATRIGAGMTQLSQRSATFADAVTGVKSQINTTIEKNIPLYALTALLPSGVQQAVQASFVNQLGSSIHQLITNTAGDISAQGPVNIEQAARFPDGENTAIPPPPPEGASAAENAAYWASLTEAQRLQLAREEPELVGNRDGFSAKHRDIANRILLDREHYRLTVELDKINKRLDEIPRGPGAHVLEDPLERQRDELSAKISAIEEIRSLPGALDQNLPDQQKYYVLKIDGREDGQIAVARGNPDTAANVATSVLGVGNNLGTITGGIENSDRIWQAAQEAGSPSTSVITWLGYDAPDTVPLAVSVSNAEAGKGELDDFQDGLRAAHQGPPSQNTVVAHSYGSTLTGHAARDESLAVDQLALLGSPGTGTQHVSELRLDGVPEGELGQRVYATVSASDPIQVANEPIDSGPYQGYGAPLDRGDFVHGPSPADPDFGAQTFESEPDGGHSYFEEGQVSLEQVGEIIAGRR